MSHDLAVIEATCSRNVELESASDYPLPATILSYFPAQAAMLTDLVNPWLRCSNKPTVTHPEAHWTLSTYTRCKESEWPTGIIIGNNEGHSWPGFHNFGENDAQAVWDTLVAHHPAS